MSAYLVMVQGMRGLAEPQVWYSDDGKGFVGSPVKVLEKHALPDRFLPWGVNEAVKFVEAMQFVERAERVQ